MSIRKNILWVVVIYLIALTGIYIFQRKLLYFPVADYTAPNLSNAPENVKEFPVRTEDGLDLKGWYVPAMVQKPTIVFFHGNADSLRTIGFVGLPYIGRGYGFLLAEYRGYSAMPGTPTEQGLYADGRAYIKALIASGVTQEDIVIMGHSLGTGVAVQMASEFKVRGLILMAPYLSVAKIAQIRLPIFPAEFMTLDRFESFQKIPNIHLPLLIVNGEQDKVIPPAQGKQLFDLANEPKEFLSVPDAGHNDLFETEFLATSERWLAQLP